MEGNKSVGVDIYDSENRTLSLWLFLAFLLNHSTNQKIKIEDVPDQTGLH